MLRLLRTRSHLTVAVARLVAEQQDTEQEAAPAISDARTGYLEAPPASGGVLHTPLQAFETDAPHKPREEQSEEERARLDEQTNVILAQLKAQMNG
jgi:hypothetical protein